MKLTGGILGWGGERLGGVHGSLVGYVTNSVRLASISEFGLFVGLFACIYSCIEHVV